MQCLSNTEAILVMAILLILKVQAVVQSVALMKMERTPLDGYTCLPQDLITSTGVWDVSRCVHMCTMNDTCLTVFYNPHQGKCESCSAKYSSSSLPLPSEGFLHFQKWLQTCDEGWAGFEESCYALSPAANFEDGVAFCETYGGHPVFVETAEENEFLKGFLASDSSIFWFMGMTDSTAEGDWRYYGTNEVVTFFDFHHAEPNDNQLNGQQCSIIVSASFGFNYQWADHFCSEVIPTVCEKPLQ